MKCMLPSLMTLCPPGAHAPPWWPHGTPMWPRAQPFAEHQSTKNTLEEKHASLTHIIRYLLAENVHSLTHPNKHSWHHAAWGV